MIFRHSCLSRLTALSTALAIAFSSLPAPPARSALLETERVIGREETGEQDGNRARLAALLARQEVETKMRGLGVSPADARARAESLSDREIALVLEKIDRLPAGGLRPYTDEEKIEAYATLIILAIAAIVGLIGAILESLEDAGGVVETPGECERNTGSCG